MNLSELSELLQQLLLDNDIVFLPGMGSFVVEDVPSEFLKSGQLITPPSRKIAFRSSENRNDGLLIAAYGKLKKLPEQKAAEEVSVLVRQMKKELVEKAYVEIPGFGTIRFGEGYNFVFVQDVKINVAPDSFGLEPLSLKIKEEPVKADPVSDGEDFIISAADIELVREKKATGKEKEVADDSVTTVSEPEPQPVPEGKKTAKKTEGTVVEKKEPTLSPAAKKTLLIVAIVAGVLVLIIVILVIFKEQFMPLWEKLLYSKEDLQILHRAGR